MTEQRVVTLFLSVVTDLNDAEVAAEVHDLIETTEDTPIKVIGVTWLSPGTEPVEHGWDPEENYPDHEIEGMER